MIQEEKKMLSLPKNVDFIKLPIVLSCNGYGLHCTHLFVLVSQLMQTFKNADHLIQFQLNSVYLYYADLQCEYSQDTLKRK